MKYAIIINDKVSSIVESNSALMENWVEGELASIGDSYDGINFTKPPIDIKAYAEYERNIRNTKLINSDWTQVVDSTADKAAWATYRQALRDITKQDGFPLLVIQPISP